MFQTLGKNNSKASSPTVVRLSKIFTLYRMIWGIGTPKSV